VLPINVLTPVAGSTEYKLLVASVAYITSLLGNALEELLELMEFELLELLLELLELEQLEELLELDELELLLLLIDSELLLE
jgi:hypothetical protein